jgi:hypothetical protein
MDQHRTVEPQSIKFARFLRDRHWISAAGLNLARVVLAKYAGFAGAGTERPALLDHGLIWPWRGGDALVRNEMDGKSHRVPAEFAPSKSESARSTLLGPGTMIQRKSLPSAPPASDGFPTMEPHVALRSAILNDTSPFEVSRGPGFLLAADRFSASASLFRKSARTAPTASATRGVLLRPALPSRKTPEPARALPESDGPHSVAPIPRGAQSREQSAALFRFDRTTTPMGKDADHGAPSGQPRFVSPVLAGIPVLEMAANQPNLVGAARDSVATTFAISSQTSSWRVGEGAKSLGDFRSPTPSLVQAWVPEPFHAEFFWRDIRVNPLGRASRLAENLNSGSAATFSAPPLDLSLQLAKTPVASDSALSAVESSPRQSLAEAEKVMASSTNSETRPPATPQIVSIPEVADRVYRLLERRLVIERERRGVFRT